MKRSDFNSYIKNAKRIVVKVGSARVSGDKRAMNDFIYSLAGDIRQLFDDKKEVILVSSGAVAQGKKVLSDNTGRHIDKKTIIERQALAAIGQSKLMSLYESFFSRVNVPISQILFGMLDIKETVGAENLRNTFNQLLSWKILPIVNENDSIATEELKLGDNDILSALVTLLMQADLLIILTGVNGFNRDGKDISYLSDVTEKDLSFAKGPDGPGTGGMNTKLKASKLLLSANIPTAIINGRDKQCLSKLIQINKSGTLIANGKKPKRLKIEEIQKLF